MGRRTLSAARKACLELVVPLLVVTIWFWYVQHWSRGKRGTANRKRLLQVNRQGLKLECSHYIPLHVQGRGGRLPCVVYAHCNSGSRRDAEEALLLLNPLGISVMAVDFAVRHFSPPGRSMSCACSQSDPGLLGDNQRE
jgi:hypothetical protein